MASNDRMRKYSLKQRYMTSDFEKLFNKDLPYILDDLFLLIDDVQIKVQEACPWVL